MSGMAAANTANAIKFSFSIPDQTCSTGDHLLLQKIRSLTMMHRREIDGLRGLAIAAVVLFHVNSTWLPGGFAGVDVFLTISGYLITSIIHGRLQQGQFSLLSFYERRIYRLLPSFITVTLCTAIAAGLLLMPEDLSGFGGFLKTTSFLMTNFAAKSFSDYFATQDQPLLHLWSICLEVQFYAAYALALALTGRYRKAWLFPLILLTTAISFILSCTMIDTHPRWVFYLLPFRFWEFGLGALAACPLLPVLSRKWVAETVNLTGLALIVVPLAVYDAATAFPGLAALPLCLGTALLLGNRNHSGAVGLILKSAPLTLIGLISYSLYLWHWPVSLFYDYYTSSTQTVLDALTILVLCGILSVAAWWLVERPFYRRRPPFSRKALLGAIGASLLALGLGGTVIERANGWPDRWSTTGKADLATLHSDIETGCAHGHTDIVARSASGNYCTIGSKDTPPTWALWGDSQARAFSGTFAQTLDKAGLSAKLFNLHGCPPLVQVGTTLYPDGLCTLHNRHAYQQILTSPEISNVVLFSRYSMYLHGTSWSGGAGQKARNWLTDQNGQRLNEEERVALFAQSLRTEVAELTRAGKTVYLYYPNPEAEVSAARMVLLRDWWQEQPVEVRIPLGYYRALNREVLPVLDGLAAEPPGALVRIEPATLLCNQDSCPTKLDGHLLLRDSNHPTDFASGILARPLAEAMERDRHPE